MAVVRVKTIPAGGTFLHPEKRLPLRVVEPNGLGVAQGDSLPASNTVFAVDDEGGMYAVRPDQQVEVTFNVPLVTRESQDHYIIVASFERQLSDDLPMLRRNFKEGRITADPEENLPLAAMQQLALEMQEAFDNGMGGFFQSHRVILGRAFDRDVMGWKRRS